MNLVQITAGELNWLRSLGRKLFRQTPWQVAVGTLVFIVGQLCLLAAFLMPLKVILLVASDGVPLYLAPIVSAERKDDFVLLLAVAAIASYGVYHLCSSVVSRAVASGAQRVQAKARKLHLFSNQEELAEQGYLRFIRCIGSAFIAVLGFAAGALQSGRVRHAVRCHRGGVRGRRTHSAVRYTSFPAAGRSPLREAWHGGGRALLGELPGGVRDPLVQFLQVEQLSVIVAIVSVILIRQVLQRSAACVQDLAYLSKNRLRLMTLFYTSIQYLPPADKHHNAFLEGLRPEPRNRWLANALSEVVGVALARVHSRWLDTGTPGVAHLDVTAAGQRWFVKYFSHRHSLRAAHEAQLFTTHPMTCRVLPGISVRAS
ncbi:MAG: hypothetical protein U5L11_00310 [Arhodomonas sp.]|nr:hypothetical protein [Arhodomonas sp.]